MDWQLSNCLDVFETIVHIEIVFTLCVSFRCSLIIVTITSYIFINIFQTGYLSAMKSVVGYDKKNQLSCDTKSLKKRSSKKNGLDSFKVQNVSERVPSWCKLLPANYYLNEDYNLNDWFIVVHYIYYYIVYRLCNCK